jgi:S1-C subfamily serine protease
MPAIVYVQTIRDTGNTKEIESGSGVLITSDGVIVTNAHVIKDHDHILVTTNDNRQHGARIIGIDEQTDLAVIQIKYENSPFLFIGNSHYTAIGDIALVFGSPLKLRNSVSMGIISGKNRNLNLLGSGGIESYFQTDALANPGNSGGALVNTDGQIIGIVSAINSTDASSGGFTFAIKSNIVKKVAFDLINHRSVQRAWIGATVRDVQPSDMTGFVAGAYLQRIENRGPAESAGLKKDDIIFKADSFEVENSTHFLSILAEKKPGDTMHIRYFRNSKEQSALIHLKNQYNTTEQIAHRNDPELEKLGLTVRGLNENEKDLYKTKGVLVISVKRDSKAAKSNMEPGYIIEKLNSEPVIDIDDLIEKILKTDRSLRLEGFYKNYPGKFPYLITK